MATRFYFHDALASAPPSGNYPTTKQSHWTAEAQVDANSINRTMDTVIGTAQVQKRCNSVADSSQYQAQYYTRFVSPALDMTSISAVTWTLNFAARESSLSANFPVGFGGGNDTTNFCLYVWRPSTGVRIGSYIHDDYTTIELTEGASANTEYSHQVTRPGTSVSSMLTGDVLIWEQWFDCRQATSTSYNDDFFYDGTTVTTTSNTVVSNHASFIETTQNLTFQITDITMTEAASKTYANKVITKT